MTRRLVRTSPVPKSADDFFQEKGGPSVVSARVVGSHVTVKTYCGVYINCKIIGVRKISIGVVYDVLPADDPKIKEFQSAGVPITPENARDKFVAFDWQIVT